MKISQEVKDRAKNYMSLKKSVSELNTLTHKIKDRLKKESIKDIEWIANARRRREAGLCEICMVLYIWCQCDKKVDS